MTVKPKYTAKDSVFKSLFSQPEYLLQLYQALHPEDTETTESDITDVTLESILAGHEYNDLGFTVKDKLIILVEAQSNWSVNIVIRSLLYLMNSLKEYFTERKANLYSSAKVKFPKPELYVIYVGEKDNCPDTISLRREYFPDEYCCIEAETKVIRENTSTTIINQYIQFCKVLGSMIKQHGRTQEAIEETVRICKDRNLLKKYLEEHETEVIEMMTLLFDQNYVTEAYNNEIRQAALNEGREEGRGIGIIDTYISMVRKNRLSAAEAAEELGMSAVEFERLMAEKI